MPTDPQEEVVLPTAEEAEPTVETDEQVETPEEEATEEVELTPEEENAQLKAKLAKAESDKENYKKAAMAAKAKNKPKELPAKDEGFVSKKEFYQESQNKATERARAEFPELEKDKHWNEIVKKFYFPKERVGKTVEENTFLNLKAAAILYRAENPDVDNSGKKATAEIAASKTSPSKGDRSQSKKSDNTETEDYYLKKLGLSE